MKIRRLWKEEDIKGETNDESFQKKPPLKTNSPKKYATNELTQTTEKKRLNNFTKEKRIY